MIQISTYDAKQIVRLLSDSGQTDASGIRAANRKRCAKMIVNKLTKKLTCANTKNLDCKQPA
ncbi:MAG: hypothetical protein RRY23_07635 [Alistipes sp.]